MTRFLTRPVLRALAALPVLACTVLAVPAGAPALAATAIDGPGGFGVTPAPGPGGHARGYFNLAIAPGRSDSDKVVITNLGKTTQRLRVTVSKGVTAANSGSAYEPLTGRCTGAACWVTGLPGSVTLGPGASRALPFRVMVPAGTRDGQYLAGVSAEAATGARPVRVGGHSSKAIIIDQVTTGVAVTVGRLARMRTAVDIRDVSAAWMGSLDRLSIGVRNVGQTFAQATGKISCQADGRARSFRVTMNTVLPGGRAVLAVNGPGLVAGRVPCTISLRDSAGGRIRWSGDVSVPPRVLTRTYHPAKGVYVALPENTTPPWAIALMVLGALIFGCLSVLLGLRYRRTGQRAAAERRA